MSGILLTKTSTFIIGPVATLLGYLMSGIFKLLGYVGISNIGLSIVFFTIIVYVCMLPLTVKQQKFSKLQSKMAPELKAIQKKYEGKKDQDSMMAMNAEQKELYAQYGVSPSGSCVQLLIQFPIMIALYRVIYNVPAYVPAVKAVFTNGKSGLVDILANTDGAKDFVFNIENFKNAASYTKQFEATDTASIKNTFIDILNKASTTEWSSLADKFPDLANLINGTYAKISSYNDFFGLNIGNSPWYTIKDCFSSHGHYGLIIGAILIPVLSALGQYVSVKLMPQVANQESTGNETADTMMQSMKMMNYTMPLFSAYMCLILPAGLGLYWATGSWFRCFSQIAINRHIDKIDFDEVIRVNKEKAAKKVKKEVNSSTLLKAAQMSTKSIDAPAKASLSQAEKDELVAKAKEKNKNASSGSLAAKANKVREYNEKNSSK